MTRELILISAAGNRFALHDAFRSAPLEDPGALAFELGRRDELALDGLLQLLPATPAMVGADEREVGACAMTIHNVDGSRSEACGNGLRCVARVAVEREHVAGTRFVVETDAGPRGVEVLELDPNGLARVRASMGVPELIERALTLDVREGRIEVVVVKVGNPHAVLFVPDATDAPVASIGEQVENHEAFPDRTNVEFVDARKRELFVRVWERGVGETRACGTGAVAAALAAVATGRSSAPIVVHMPGGDLTVTLPDATEATGEATLEGPVEMPANVELRESSELLR